MFAHSILQSHWQFLVICITGVAAVLAAINGWWRTWVTKVLPGRCGN